MSNGVAKGDTLSIEHVRRAKDWLKANDAFDPANHIFAEAGSSDGAKRWADSTQRSREHRMRKKLGLSQRTVRLTRSQAAKLIELGYLSFASKGIPRAEAIAIEAWLADSLS